MVKDGQLKENNHLHLPVSSGRKYSSRQQCWPIELHAPQTDTHVHTHTEWPFKVTTDVQPGILPSNEYFNLHLKGHGPPHCAAMFLCEADNGSWRRILKSPFPLFSFQSIVSPQKWDSSFHFHPVLLFNFDPNSMVMISLGTSSEFCQKVKHIRKQACVYWMGAKCNSARLESVIVVSMLPRAFCNQLDLKKKEKTN